MNDDDLHPVVRVVVTVLALATFAFAGWCTVLAFIGGTAPIFGWELEGSVGQGLLWMFIVTPIITTIGYWASMLVAMPFMAIFRR
jgi:hypothetical protein